MIVQGSTQANLFPRPPLRGFQASSRLINWAILIYVHLWILEGLLRKLVPGANEILYFSRDGLAIVAVVLAISYGRLRAGHFLGLSLAGLIIVWTCLGALSGSDAAGVWIVGVRSYIAPLLFVFLISLSGSFELIRSIRAIILFQLPLQALVVIAQVTSPANSIWNLQTTGEEAHFLNDGIARASGTFSAPAGLLGYIVLAVALALAALVSSSGKDKWIAAAGLIAALCIGSLSGSRGAVLTLGLLVCGFIYWILANGTFGRFLLVVFIAFGAAGVFVLISASFPEVVAAFGNRVQDAAQSENTVVRIGYTLFGFFGGLDSILGSGAGQNSQAGIAVGASGPWIENESLRWVSELGILGLGLALVRLFFGFKLLGECLFRVASLTPHRYMLGVASVVVLLQGTISQNPSAQGAFSILVALFLWSNALGPAEAGSNGVQDKGPHQGRRKIVSGNS